MRTLLIILTMVTTTNIHAEEALPDLNIENISQNVYQHKSYQYVENFGLVSSNGLIVIDKHKAFIVDTPWSDSDTQKLVNWVKKQGYDLAGSISTHSHEDRTAGIKWLNSHSIPTYASKFTNQLLKKDGKELALNEFKSSELVLLGGSLEAFYPGEGHTVDNIVVWLPKSKILFGGCFIRSLGTQNLGYTGEASIDKWSDSVKKVLSRYPDAQIVVPGHGKSGNIELLEHTKKLAESASDKLTRPSAKASD